MAQSGSRQHASLALLRITRACARRKAGLASKCLLVSVVTITVIGLTTGVATADVNMSGRLEKIASTSTSPGEVKSLATSANGTYRCADQYSVVANWYYYFAIGNCPQGAEIEVVSYAAENSKHEHSYGGFINGAFSGCGWINTAYPLEKLNTNSHSACAGSGESREFGKGDEETFLEKYNKDATGEGTPVNNRKPCPEYANYRPWSSNNVEKELIRTAPEYAASGPGSRYPALKWRYVTKYASTDGSGKYVMVEDDRITGSGEGNWVFVPLSCLAGSPSELPENPKEELPPAPTATTGEATSLAPTSATLSGSANPNGIETHYYIEWGTEASKPYEAFAPTPYPGEDIGAGKTTLNKSVSATGLKPYTTYYYKLVAKSATGTGEGVEKSFATPAQKASATTEAASSVQFRRATLNGKVNPNGAPTEYFYQYGTTSSYGLETSKVSAGSGSSAVSAPFTETGLSPNTTYHFRLVANNPAGLSYGGEETFTTAAVPVLSVAKPGESTIALTWTASAGASSYTVKRDGSTVATTTTPSYTDTKLNSTTFYEYEVVANETNETGGSSAVVRATTQSTSVPIDLTTRGRSDLVYIYPGGYIDTLVPSGSGKYTKYSWLIGKEFDSTSGLWMSGAFFNTEGKDELVYVYPGGYIDTFTYLGKGEYHESSEQVSAGFDDDHGTWKVGHFAAGEKEDLVYIYRDGHIDSFYPKETSGQFEEDSELIGEDFDTTTGHWLTGTLGQNGETDLAYVYPGTYIDTFFPTGHGAYQAEDEPLLGFDGQTGLWLTGDFDSSSGKTELLYVYPGTYLDTFQSKGNGEFESHSEYREGFDGQTGRWLPAELGEVGTTDLAYIYPGTYLDTFTPAGPGKFTSAFEERVGFDGQTGQWLVAKIEGEKADLVYIYPGTYIETFVPGSGGSFKEESDYLEGFDGQSGLWL